MAKWKGLNPSGFATLIETIKESKRTSGALASDVSGIQGDIQGFIDRVTEVFTQVSDCFQSLNNLKLDKPSAVAVTIPLSGWATESSEEDDYPAYCDLTLEGVTDKDRVNITLAPSSVKAAVDCGICPTCVSGENTVSVFAAEIPAENIEAEYWIEKGLDLSDFEDEDEGGEE